RPADPLDLGSGGSDGGIPGLPPLVECRALRVDYTDPSAVLLQPRIASDGGTRTTGASPDHYPVWYGELLPAQLRKHRLGDVFVATPVGGPFGIGELVEVVPAAPGCQIGRHMVDRRRILDQVAASAVELDQLAFFAYGRGRHHSHERQGLACP